jgi:hypothetical protein
MSGARRRKPALFAWSLAIGVALSAALLLVAFRALKETKQSDQAPIGGSLAQQRSAFPENVPVPPAQAVETSAVPSSTPGQTTRPEADSRREARPEIQSEIPQEERPGASSGLKATGGARPKTGVIMWSGEILKNSILIITGPNCSIGSMNGQLPGRPVQIKLEPASLTIRQMPARENGWSQIMIYTGNQKFTSIAIHWKTIE